MEKNKNKKIVSYMKKPKRVPMKDQNQIIAENRQKREAFLKKIKTHDR